MYVFTLFFVRGFHNNNTDRYQSVRPAVCMYTGSMYDTWYVCMGTSKFGNLEFLKFSKIFHETMDDDKDDAIIVRL